MIPRVPGFDPSSASHATSTPRVLLRHIQLWWARPSIGESCIPTAVRFLQDTNCFSVMSAAKVQDTVRLFLEREQGMPKYFARPLATDRLFCSAQWTIEDLHKSAGERAGRL